MRLALTIRGGYTHHARGPADYPGYGWSFRCGLGPSGS